MSSAIDQVLDSRIDESAGITVMATAKSISTMATAMATGLMLNVPGSTL